MNNKLKKTWSATFAFLERYRPFGWVDVVIILGLAGVLYGLTHVAEEWAGPLRRAVAIDLSPWALPEYTFFSLCRGLAAYVLSFIFTMVYGYWAAKDKLAERVLVPLLDILQSIPVLGFMPGLFWRWWLCFPSRMWGWSWRR